MQKIDPVALGLDIVKFSYNQKEVQCYCPYHSDEHPSAWFNTEKGLFFCFACGTSKSANEIAKDFKTEVVRKSNLKTGKLDLDYHVVDLNIFSRARKALDNEYLMQRGITNDTIEKFDIRQINNAIVFLVKGSRKQIIGVQLRLTNSNTKQLRYLNFGDKTTLWSLPYFMENINKKNIVVTEGIFGALKLYQFGYTGIATLGVNGVYNAAHLLKYCDNIKIYFDNDYAGILNACVLSNMINAKVLVCGEPSDEISEDKIHKLMRIEGFYDTLEIANHSSLFDSQMERMIFVKKVFERVK